MRGNKTIRWKLISKGRMSWLGKETLELGYKALRYSKGKMTVAPKDSMGCFCFKTKKEALDSFHSSYFLGDRIIKVQTFGRGKICYWAPEGTICYPAVMALE